MLTQSLIDAFNTYFTVEIACKPNHYEDMYKLRYDVYIDEFGFDAKENYPNQLESDEFDDISTACIIYHIPTNTPAACVRLVPGYDCTQLPIEKFVGYSLDPTILKDLNEHRYTLAEISRLAVSKQFRRRDKEHLSPMGYYNEDDERTYPLISVACFLACVIIADIINTENNIASMEPFLPRLVKRSGMVFEQIGPAVDYHGNRATYLIHKQQVLDQLSQESKHMIDQMQHDMLAQMLTIY